MLKIILVRHAESKMNRLGIHQGQLYDSELSPEGIGQAKALVKRLKNERILEIYSSDMRRAFQTSTIIGDYLGLFVNKDRRLREFNMGEFDKSIEKRDTLFEEFYKEQLKKGVSKFEIRPPGGENIWDFIKRIKSFLDEIKNKRGAILVVAHGGSIEVALNLIEGAEKNNFRKIYQDNCCINEILFENNLWGIISVNDSRHIPIKLKPKSILKNKRFVKKVNSVKYKVNATLIKGVKDIPELNKEKIL